MKTMEKLLALGMAGVLFVSMLSACGGSATESLSGSVSLNGSASMEKVVGALSEQFVNDNADVTVTCDPTGIEPAKNGSCDIGLASRCSGTR